MKFASHGNGNGLNDLYILPESEKEKDLIKSFIKKNDIKSSSMFYAHGDEWENKLAFEIPFGEGWKKELVNFII
jgi:hypothetical protein